MSLHTGLDERRAADLPNFSVGGIIWRSFWITLWNFFRFVGLALVIAVPPAAVIWLLLDYGHVQATFDTMGRVGATSNVSDFQITSPPGETLTFLAIVFIGLIVYLMIQAAIVYRTFRSLGGYGADIGACLARSLGVLLHLAELAVVASILLGAFAVLIVSETVWLQAQGQFGIAVFFAILLLGVLVFIVTGCWVVFPALVIEQIGPVAAILRSWRLTRGRRWHILALLVVFAAIEFAVFYLFTVEIKITLPDPYATYGQYAVLVLNLPLAFFATVMLTTSYYNLVGEKDGVTALGRIFV